jgi:hypothetical protein
VIYSAVRVAIGVVAVLLLLGGLVAVAAGQIGPGLWTMGLGAAGLLAVAFERVRYRSESAERMTGEGAGPGGGEAAPPAAPFRRTEETFLDPTTRRVMRVYVDPSTGERRYHAES